MTATIEFPTLVYKNGGPYQRSGGTYNYKSIASNTDLQAALETGWSLSLVAAINPQVDDELPPTRLELETKCSELGIKFDKRTSDRTLLSKIEAALSDK